MSDQPPSLNRDNTMAVTAKEGEAFLKSQGMEVATDVDVKTRSQKEKLDEITSPQVGEDGEENGEGERGGDAAPKLSREGTMAVTAKEGAQLLEGKELEKTRAQTAAAETDGGEEENKEEEPKKPRMPRESTMAVTAQEGANLLEGEELEKTRAQTSASKTEVESPTTPSKVKRSTTIFQTTEDSTHIIGGEDLGRTRSQTRKRSESTPDEKPSMKRTSTMAQTAKEGEEFLEREASIKRAKLEAEGAGESKEESVAKDE